MRRQKVVSQGHSLEGVGSGAAALGGRQCQKGRQGKNK
jgi:hypothetical protein